jgi:hypothetical protein
LARGPPATPVHMRTIVAALLAALVPAVPAQPPVGAEIPPIEGYVWASQPATAGYTASTGYEHNSHGGAVQIQRSSPGVYQVRFVGMAGVGGVAHVSAYGGNGFCTVASWGPSTGDELVNVRCFTPTGVAADTRFTAHVTNRTDGAARGYLWSSDPTPPAAGTTPPSTWSYDSAGESIVVSATGTGNYEVELGAFAQDAGGAWADAALRVTAYGASPVSCQIGDPSFYADPEVLRVQCYDPTGSAVNSRFALSYVRGVVPVSSTVDNLGGSPDVIGWSSPAGLAPSADEVGDADYLISFPAAGVAGGHAYAGLVATPPVYCNIQSWTVMAGALNLRVRCYQLGNGEPNPAMLINVGFFT